MGFSPRGNLEDLCRASPERQRRVLYQHGAQPHEPNPAIRPRAEGPPYKELQNSRCCLSVGLGASQAAEITVFAFSEGAGGFSPLNMDNRIKGL
jgi:hypothetical protein